MHAHAHSHTHARTEVEVEVQTADRRPQTGHPFPIACELERAVSLSELIDTTDVMVDAPPAGTPAAVAKVRPVKPPKAGSATKVCSYEELHENNLSDCSAESGDFNDLMNWDITSAKPPSARRANGARGGGGSKGAGGARGRVERHSLLTEVDLIGDVLVS
eukprot:scaffold10376_cov66-Phaeocystis_antarctica.AAC.4